MDLHKENIIELRNIHSLSGLNFYIPDYQRGYRWTATQAREMIKDFKEFIDSGNNSTPIIDGYYCLQPIVVKPASWKDVVGNEIAGYEVIDGQQRLTTLFLLLTAIFNKDSRNRNDNYARKFKMFTISYQTRSDSRNFLDNIENDEYRVAKAYNCIDFYHINNVYETFKLLLNSQSEQVDERDLLKLLLSENMKPRENDEDKEEEDVIEIVDNARNVRVIWYQIGTEEKASAENIFTRLNIGKIPLTNAELIKAMFLKVSNFGKVTASKENERRAQEMGISLQQNKIAEEWNVMEQKLQRDDFWYFLGADAYEKVYETRIEFIFDLMAEWQKDMENYHTFNHFQNLIKNAGKKNAAENVWKIVKEYFRELEYWYNDKTLYHLIGFLIESGYSIRELMHKRSTTIIDESGNKLTQKLKKDEFLKQIHQEVSNSMNGINLDLLRYPDDNIQKALLLFNILSVIENDRSDIRFPFDKYKKENWDKEHIASQTDKDKSEVPQDNAKRIEWIDDMLYYFTGIRTSESKEGKGKKLPDGGNRANTPVLEELKAYIADEEKAAKTIGNASLRQERETEIDLMKRLLRVKALSDLLPKQRSAEQREEYDTQMKRLYSDTRVYFNEDRIEESEKDTLGNMALLNASINRSYGNAFFAIKRMHIQDRDSDGVFIPLATKNVFMKYYSKRVDSMLVWTHDDANSYLAVIKKKLAPYLNSQQHEQ